MSRQIRGLEERRAGWRSVGGDGVLGAWVQEQYMRARRRAAATKAKAEPPVRARGQGRRQQVGTGECYERPDGVIQHVFGPRATRCGCGLDTAGVAKDARVW